MVSAEEVRLQCIEAMGDELGNMYCDLNDHLLDIYLIWRQLEQLFGQDEATVKLLNQSAPLFFSVVQAQLWDSVILGISRLTDEPVMRSNKNLSIGAVPALIGEETLKKSVKELCDKAVADAEFARKHRHKRIAHNDLKHFREKTAKPLPGVNRDKIRKSLSSICDVLHALNGHYRESVMLYDDLIFEGGAGRLIGVLKRGSKHNSA